MAEPLTGEELRPVDAYWRAAGWVAPLRQEMVDAGIREHGEDIPGASGCTRRY